MKKFSFYGKVIRVFDTTDLGFGESRETILERYEEAVSGVKQAEKKALDRQYLQSLNENRLYSTTWSQQIGHNYQSKRSQVFNPNTGKYVLLKPDYQGNVIIW